MVRCLVTQNGLQQIMVSDTSSSRTGSYNLYVQRLSAPSESTSLLLGQSHARVIATAAEATTFTFTGQAHDAVVLRMAVTAGDMRPHVRVFQADGSLVCSGSNPYGAGVETPRCVLPPAGTYTVLAGDTNVTRTGSYNLSLQRFNDPAGAMALDPGTTRLATLQVAGIANSYTISGQANEVFLLRMGVTSGDMRPHVRVFQTDGSLVCSGSNPYGTGVETNRCAHCLTLDVTLTGSLPHE